MGKNERLDAALKYREMGLSIIPIRRKALKGPFKTEEEKASAIKENKRPLMEWKKYQQERAVQGEIEAWFKRQTDLNIAVVTGKISGICIVDVDTPEGKDEILNYLPDSLECPTCTTPRGGVHYYFKLPEKPLPNNVGVIPGCDFRGEGGYALCPPSDNGNGSRYKWLSGLSFFDVPLPELPQEYIRYVTSNLKKEATNTLLNIRARSKEDAKVEKYFSSGRRDNDLFHIANCMVKGKTPLDEVHKLLEICIKSWGENPDQKWIKDKIDSAIKRLERSERNLNTEVTEWVLSSSGVFLSSNIVDCLQCRQREEQKNVSKILSRLVEDGVIERFGDKNGCFRKVETEAPDIDFVNADDSPVYFKWPFGIEQYYNLMPKNVVIVAGEKDAGKTAFLLNVVKLNMDRHKIFYFSSEMGSSEFKSRLKLFEGFPLTSWHFHPKERSGNFHDVIKPDDINIIDFLEIHDDFYRVGGMIRQIFDKLNTGVAIIALQKPRGRDEARGGEITKEKSRLYLSMGGGKIKITNVKNWVHPQINPRNMELKYKLVNGCDFRPDKTWERNDD